MDEPGAQRRPTRLAGAAVGLFFLAILVGRLLLAGGAAWVLLAFLLPLIVVALGVGLGFRTSLVMALGFTAAVLAVRWFLRDNPAGWVALLLVPVVVLTAIVVGRVLGKMRQRPDGAPEPGAEGQGPAAKQE